MDPNQVRLVTSSSSLTGDGGGWSVENNSIMLSKLFLYLVNRTGFDTAQGN